MMPEDATGSSQSVNVRRLDVINPKASKFGSQIINADEQHVRFARLGAQREPHQQDQPSQLFDELHYIASMTRRIATGNTCH